MAFTNRVVKEARVRGLSVEAEIGRLSGTEDGLTVEEYEARLTSVDQVYNPNTMPLLCEESLKTCPILASEVRIMSNNRIRSDPHVV